jgi:hypothetical protein
MALLPLQTAAMVSRKSKTPGVVVVEVTAEEDTGVVEVPVAVVVDAAVDGEMDHSVALPEVEASAEVQGAAAAAAAKRSRYASSPPNECFEHTWGG